MKTRQELVEVMAKAIWQDMYNPASCHYVNRCHSVPCACSTDSAKLALTAIEAAGARVVPEEITSDMRYVSGDWEHSNISHQQWSRALNASPFKGRRVRMSDFHKCGECDVMFTLDDPATLTANYESVCAERDRLKAALEAARGYMMNVLIDLQGDTPQMTTIKTLRGGINLTSAALTPPTAEKE